MKNFTLSSMLKRVFAAFVAVLCITTVSAQDWTIAEENTMAGSWNTKITDPIFIGGNGWQMFPAKLDGSSFYPSLMPNGNEFIAIKVEINQAAEYKFSFDIKANAADNQIIQLYYDTTNSLSNKIEASAQTYVTTTDIQTIESNVLTLEAGTYYMAAVIKDGGFDAPMLSFGNFKLYKRGGEVAPTTYEVTWDAPANGILVVKNGNEVLTSPATVEENTELTVEATADSNYELETLTANGSDIMAEKKFIVTSNTEIIATFKETGVAPTLSAIRIPDQEATNTKKHYQFRFDDELLGDHSSEDNRTRNLTMSVWMKPRSVNGQFFGLVQSKFWGSFGTFWVKSVNGKYALGNRSLTAAGGFQDQADLTTDQEVVLNEWAYVTVVINNDTKERSIYYNGELLQTSSIINEGLGMLPDESVFFVGGGIVEGSNQEITNDAALDIDEVQVWTKALTASEVKQSMGNVNAQAEGLAYLYRFTSKNADNTYNNLAAGDVKASLRYGNGTYDRNQWATIYSSEIVAAESVEGHSAVVVPPTTYQVTWTTPTNGSIVVKNGVDELTSPATVEEGTVLTIEATADNGYELESITANGTPVEAVDGVYSVTVNADTEIAATFDTTGPKMLDLVVYKGGRQAFWGLTRVYVNEEVKYQEYGQSSQTLQVLEGSTVKVEATEAEPGFAEKYSVVVLVGGKEVALDANDCYEFVMSKETTSITVNYNDPGKKYNYVINKTGEGNVSITAKNITYEAASGQLTENTEFVVNAQPATGYILESLEVIIGGETQTGDKYVVTGDIEINVTFAEITYQSVTLVKPENGNVNVEYVEDGRTKNVSTADFTDTSKTFDVPTNTVLTITAQANTYYELVAITCNDNKLDGSTYTVEEATSISAEFKAITYTVNFEQPENATLKVMNGTTEINNGDEVNAGTEITVTAEAELGYEIESIKVNGNDITLEGKFTLTENANIVVTVKIIDAINETVAAEVYYNNVEQAIYTNNAKVVKVYDLSGRLVLNAKNQTIVNVNELANGFYTAVVDETVIKFNK